MLQSTALQVFVDIRVPLLKSDKRFKTSFWSAECSETRVLASYALLSSNPLENGDTPPPTLLDEDANDLLDQLVGADKNLFILVHIVIEWPPANIWIKNDSCTAWNSRIVILLLLARRAVNYPQTNSALATLQMRSYLLKKP